MDPRHDEHIPHDDLEEAFDKLKVFWSRFGRAMVLTLLIVVIFLVGYRWYQSNQAQKLESAWSERAAMKSPEQLADFAERTDVAGARSLARLDAADFHLGKAAQLATVQPDTDTSAEVDQAELLYRKVIDDPQAHEVFKLNAHLGLGVAAETRGDFEAAEKQFQTVLEQAGEKYQFIRAQAQSHLDLLPHLREKVQFAPGPPPAESAAKPGDAPIAPNADITLPQDQELPGLDIDVKKPAANDVEKTAPADDAAKPAPDADADAPADAQ